MKTKSPPTPKPRGDSNKSPSGNNTAVSGDKRATHNSKLSAAHSSLPAFAAKQ